MEQTLTAYTRAELCRVAAFAFAVVYNLLISFGLNYKEVIDPLVRQCLVTWTRCTNATLSYDILTGTDRSQRTNGGTTGLPLRDANI